MRDEGHLLGDFLHFFTAHCRRNCKSSEASDMGLSWDDGVCVKMAEITGEPLTVIKAIYRGHHAPTPAVLRSMEWFEYDDYEEVSIRRKVKRYLPEQARTPPTTMRSINPLY